MRAVVLLAGMLSLGIVPFGVMSNAYGQAIYKWVDEQGITHFSEQPPLDVEAERTTVSLRHTNRQALQTRLDNRTLKNEAVATRKQHEKEQASEEQARDERNQQIRTDNCDRAKTRVLTYNTARRLYRPLEDGERDYLTDEELDSQRADAQKLVDEWCD